MATEIEKLSVRSTYLSKLHSAGYQSIESIAVSSPEQLEEIEGVGPETSKKIIEEARKIACELLDFSSAKELNKKKKQRLHLTTGCSGLDEIMCGGIETQAITEIFGEFGCGKSQIAHQLAVLCQLPIEKKGLDGKCVFIDTEGTFRPDRIEQIAKANKLNVDEVLNNIFIAKAWNSGLQILLVDKAEELVKNNNVKLIIVDSLTNRFRSEYVGRGKLAERQQKLAAHLARLHKLADVYNVAVVFTNQVMSKPDVFFGDPTQPIGGHVLAHSSTHRFYLRKSKAGKKLCKVYDSPILPQGDAYYKITPEGIEDAK